MTRRDYLQMPYPGLASQLDLPFWPAEKRGTPNSFLRSALFIATEGRGRRWMKNEVIASQNGVTIEYTGEQLTQTDLDVWETMTHLARIQPLGTECIFTSHGLLKILNRATGKTQYDWLHDSIVRLTTCTVTIKFDRTTFFGHLIDSALEIEQGAKDDITNVYRVRLNPQLLALFAQNQWTKLDWSERIRMLRQPLAQWLHAYWSTHHAPIPITVKRLQELSGSNIQELRYFKRHLKAALTVLVSTGFLDNFTLAPPKARGDGGLVRVTRTTKRLPAAK